jgi:hypothetical protein
MKNITIAFVSLLLLLICSESASACWCRGIDPEEKLETAVAKELRRSVLVFSGEAIERNASGLKFRVEKVWKGKAMREISLPQDVVFSKQEVFIDSCARLFEVGQRYLVYAYRERGELFVNKCSRTQILEKAEKDIEVLNRSKPEPRSRSSRHTIHTGRFQSMAKSNNSFNRSGISLLVIENLNGIRQCFPPG